MPAALLLPPVVAERLGEAAVPPDLPVVSPLEADLTFTEVVPVFLALLVVLAGLAFLVVLLFAAPADFAVLLALVLPADLAVVLAPVLLVEAALVADDLVAALFAVEAFGDAAFLVAVLLLLAFLVPAEADLAVVPDLDVAALVVDLAVDFAAAVLELAALVPVAFALAAVPAEPAFLVPVLAVVALAVFFVPVKSPAVFSTFRTTLFTTLVTASGIMLDWVLLVGAISEKN